MKTTRQKRSTSDSLDIRAVSLNESLETGYDYDHSIHSNPDAKAWAQFFCETGKKLIDEGKIPQEMLADEEWMLGWFANAMMAMHDWMQQNGWKRDCPQTEKP